MLTAKEKSKLIVKFGAHDKDTGSTEVQAVLLSEEVKRLAEHLKENPKDNHSRRGLLGMVVKRRKLLEYLKNSAPKTHSRLIKKLGLKK